MPFDETVARTNLGEMAAALAGSSPEEIREFLSSILTPAESDEIAKRWALVKALAQGMPQRQIAQDMGLSLCKITRGSRELKKEHSSFKLMLGKAGIEMQDESRLKLRRRKPDSPEELD